jgi:hypothetical protein
MTILEAKDKLYSELRSVDTNVVGAGIQEENGEEVIALYYATEPDMVLADYEGYRIIWEVTGEFYAF